MTVESGRLSLGPLEELIHNAAARVCLGPNGRVCGRDLRRAGRLDPKVRQRGQNRAQILDFERDVLDSSSASFAQSSFAHGRIEDLDQLDLRVAAAKEARLEVVALNLPDRRQAEALLEQDASAFEAVYDHSDVVDSLELHVRHVG